MADEIDFATELTQRRTEEEVRAASKAAREMPAGEPGECDLCGEHFTRLVNGVCARCRDRHNLP